MAAITKLTSETLRAGLGEFWNESLEIEAIGDGYLFTMPASLPDGWQIALEISQKTPKGYRLSDRGKTLSWLTANGQNVETEAMAGHIKRLRDECGMTLEGQEFVRWMEAPLDPVDVHVFTEGLVGVSQLYLLHDHRASVENVAETVVQRVFADAGIKAERNHRLSITKERKIQVDFYARTRKPVAVELLRTKTDLTGTMEKWGFRWDELKKHHHDLQPVMLYDRSVQMIDAYPRGIGEDKCALFCGYDETDRIHELLERSK